MPLYPLETYAFDAHLGKRSVFIHIRAWTSWQDGHDGRRNKAAGDPSFLFFYLHFYLHSTRDFLRTK